MVERAFRDCKTANPAVRPVYVRKEGRTRRHVLVVMLEYMLIRMLRKAWTDFDLTAEG